jgi:TatD DNase family protein
MRFAVGVHPLEAAKLGERDWSLFESCLPETSYVGEAGLDFSTQGRGTRGEQEQAFRRILRVVAGRGKVLSLHSRGAENAVLQLLTEHEVGPAIFHWYTGPVTVLDRLLAAGHYCSFNPAMVRSARGQAIIARVPPSRALIETDGPYVRVGGRPVEPTDVLLVYRYLSQVWRQPIATVTQQVYDNFRHLFRPELMHEKTGDE